MKVVAVCMFFVLAVGLSDSFTCPSNYCDEVDCSAGLTAEQCDGQMIPNTSECGCCPTCYKFLPLMSKCTIQSGHNSLTSVREVCSGMAQCVNHRCVPTPM